MIARALAVLAAVAVVTGCATDVTLIPGTSPQRVTAVSGVSDVTLFWEAVPGASGYRIYSGRKFEDSTSVTPLPPVGPDDFEERGGEEIETQDTRWSGLSFPDGDPLVPASFTVVALRGNGVSAPSDEVIGWRHPQHYSRVPAWTAQSNGVSFGVSMAGLGDVDGDGFEDVAIGAAGWNSGGGAVFFYDGSPLGLIPSGRFLGPPNARVGTAVAMSDSWNNGRRSVFVGAPGENTVYVFDPGSIEADVQPTPALSFTLSSGFGTTIADAGNLDGNLVLYRNEIAIGAPQFGGGGAVFLYAGLTGDGDDAVPPAPSVVICLDDTGPAVAPIRVSYSEIALCGGSNEELGFAIAGAGNLTNDPWDDLVIGAPGYADRGAIVLYEGSATLSTGSILTLRQGPVEAQAASARFGAAVASVGDADGDSLSEIAVGAPGFDDLVQKDLDDVGHIFVFPGIPTEPPYPESYEDPRHGNVAGSRLGGSLLFVQDLADSEYGLLAGAVVFELPEIADPGVFRIANAYTAFPFDGSEDTYALAEELQPPIQAPGAPGVLDDASFPVGLGAADVDGDGVTDILLSDSASGVVQLFVSTPFQGPEVLAGPLYEYDFIPGGPEFVLSLATFVDPQVTTHRCHVEWDLQPDSPLPVDDGEPCTPDSLREMSHLYVDSREYVVRVTVTAGDGRRGQSTTHVIVR